MYVAHAFFASEDLGVDASIVKDWPVLHDVCAHAAHRCHLGRICSNRHKDGALRTELLGGVGYRLTVIAGTGGDETEGAFLWCRARNKVDAASNFEGSEQLHVLELYPDIRLEHVTEDRHSP